MGKYTIGIDYGTLSGRVMIANTTTGEEVFSKEYPYDHGVIDDILNDTVKLNSDTAIQNPDDYVKVLEMGIREAVNTSKVNPENIIAIGIDFTSSTVMPVTKKLEPLSYQEKYKNNPHAYVKLWKDHASQKYADIMNEKAKELKQEWINWYGGKISSEWLFPKLIQIFYEDRQLYDEIGYFMEAGDWIVSTLCGKNVKSNCMAGYKGLWNEESGYPSEDYFEAIDADLRNIVKDKLVKNVQTVGTKAGNLDETWAKKLGLTTNTVIAVAVIDAHVFLPALKITAPKKILAIMGTSTCHILLDQKKKAINGIAGVVKDGVIPGFYAYEAGQAAVGDAFAWFIENSVPQTYLDEAAKNDIDIYTLLTRKLEKKEIGEGGLICLDWWNGNRSTLSNASLSGLIIGVTINTKPEDVFRAMIESTAFGTRKIIETFKDSGIEIESFYAAGGIALKNPWMMQVYSDVLNLEVHVCDTKQGGALGSAIYAAVAAGSIKGGYDNLEEASKNMGKDILHTYRPCKNNVNDYDKLYKMYNSLYEYFGVLNPNIMESLKNYNT